jgi:FtsH-binding integral membrane protein
MSNYDNQATRWGSVAGAQVGIDEGLRAHMLRVYNIMMLGLALTGVVAYLTFSMVTTSDPSMAAAQMRGGIMLTSLGVALYTSPLQWLVMLAPLGLVLFLSFRIDRMSTSAALTTFGIYAALLGLSLSSIFIVYTASGIAQVFFITAATFGAMSLWGYTTKRDLTAMGSFLMMGLIGIIVAMVVNIFLASSTLSYVISILGVLIFTGLTAYDTQAIKEQYYVGDDGSLAGKKAIMGALRLYLDFLNLFLMLLQLFGARRD